MVGPVGSLRGQIVKTRCLKIFVKSPTDKNDFTLDGYKIPLIEVFILVFL